MAGPKQKTAGHPTSQPVTTSQPLGCGSVKWDQGAAQQAKLVGPDDQTVCLEPRGARFVEVYVANSSGAAISYTREEALRRATEVTR